MVVRDGKGMVCVQRKKAGVKSEEGGGRGNARTKERRPKRTKTEGERNDADPDSQAGGGETVYKLSRSRGRDSIEL